MKRSRINIAKTYFSFHKQIVKGRSNTRLDYEYIKSKHRHTCIENKTLKSIGSLPILVISEKRIGHPNLVGEISRECQDFVRKTEGQPFILPILIQIKGYCVIL